MITTAVILAAGMGRRLGDVCEEMPKGFLSFGAETIIVESILKLQAFGITEIFIGTGYRQESYANLARRFQGIKCICNERFAESGSMATLRCLCAHVQADFLLLESDIIYERRALGAIIDVPERDAILTSEITSYGDEVFVETDLDAFLTGMSKDRASLSTIDGVLVGISKLSLETLHVMCEFFDDKQNESMNYEDALVEVSAHRRLLVHNAGAVVWCEIDTPEHYSLARNTVHPAVRRIDDLPTVPRNILLNPGPATTTDTVKYAQVVPDICPREREFGALMASVSEQLTALAANSAEYVTVLFGGSGTAAVEAILSSVIGNNDYLCIIDNGAYGARMCEIGNIYHIPMMRYSTDPINGVDTEHLSAVLVKSSRRITHLAVVHHETTTGVLNNIEAIGKLCAQKDIVLIVDAISSYGAIPINMPWQGIHYLAATANKNLQGMPGVSFVIAHRDSLKLTKSHPPRNLYLNLYKQNDYFESTSQMRFTPPVQSFYALRQALIETRQEGIENRYNRYSACWEILVEGLTRLGLRMIVPPEHQSKLLTTVQDPSLSGYNFEQMHDVLKRRGFTVYPGKLAGCNTFRIANIGAISPNDMYAFISALESYFSTVQDDIKKHSSNEWYS